MNHNRDFQVESLGSNATNIIILAKRHLAKTFPVFVTVKVLANEDTLLRTHCCSRCFLGTQKRGTQMNVVFPCCANWETFVADTKCFCTKLETFFVSGTNVGHRQTGKHFCRQQCVHNNVSSFARAFTTKKFSHVHAFSCASIT